MKRLSVCILVLGLATASCDYSVYNGDCFNHAFLGEDDCQCVTPDNKYSQFSESALKPDLDYLHFCADSTKSYAMIPNSSEIYVCTSYRCATKPCGANEIPNADKRSCSCDGARHFVGEAGNCTCKTGYVLIGGACEAKQTCQANQDYVEADNTCECETGYVEVSGQCAESQADACDTAKELYDATTNTCKCDGARHFIGDAGSCTCETGYVEVSGACEKSLEDTCDLIKEWYDATTNTCKCDTSKHFEGDAGSCTCETGYVLIDGACEEKQTCRDDQVYIEADNTCTCPTDYEEQDGRKCVHTGICTGANQVYDPDKDVCVCAEGTLRFGDACIAKDECTGSSRRMISQSDPGACTCFTEYTYIIDDCYKAGETLTFGRYPQDEDSDTPSPLKWRILEINDGAALLISEYVLEQYRYHDTREAITWEKSNVRSYLNGLSAAFNQNGIDYDGKGFIDNAFTAEERKWIKQVTNKNPDAPEGWGSASGGNDTEDKVFLLSHDEVLKYFPTNKSCIGSPTAYAIRPPEGSGRNNLYTCQVTCSGDDSCPISGCNQNGTNVYMCSNVQCGSHWWLRSPGVIPDDAAYVFVGGGVSSFSVNNVYPGLRPALYIHLNL